MKWRAMLEQNGELNDASRALLRQMERYASGVGCRHRHLSEYFGDRYEKDEMRRLRLLPERARAGGRAGRARAEDPVVRRARRPALRRDARRERASRPGERAGRRPRARPAQHVRAAARCVERRSARLHRTADRRGAAAAVGWRVPGRGADAERARAAEGSVERARASRSPGSGRRGRARRARSRASRPSRGRTSIAICSSGCDRSGSRSRGRAAFRRTSSSTTRRCARWRGFVPPRSTRFWR